jgi:hypothetical protein
LFGVVQAVPLIEGEAAAMLDTAMIFLDLLVETVRGHAGRGRAKLREEIADFLQSCPPLPVLH